MEARVRQGAAEYGLDVESAARRLKTEDKARREYVRSVYGVDGEDPSLYHLVLDSTALALEVCVDVIVEAAIARVADAPPIPST
jgi:cytidylate kinase